LVCFIVTLLSSCLSHHCHIDKSIRNTFNDQLLVIAEQHYGLEWGYDDDYRNAILYLRAVTDTGFNATITSTLGFTNEDGYLSDMKSWAEWYKKSKCLFTQQYVDSPLSDIILDGWERIWWVLKTDTDQSIIDDLNTLNL
jgi:hypothetical protein